MHADVEGPPAGAAPDLVLLHGGTGTGRSHWNRVARALSSDLRVHLPDLPGHGRTPLPDDRPYDFDLLGDAVEDYLEPLGRAHLAGFSMGGVAALVVAGREPERLASLVVIGVSLRHHPGTDEWRERFTPEALEEHQPLLAQHLARLHEPLGGPEAWRDVVRRDSSGLPFDADLDSLRDVRCPVLLVRGDGDPVVSPPHYAELRELWPHAEEFVVPGGGHEVQMTRYRVVEPVLSDFYRRARDDGS